MSATPETTYIATLAADAGHAPPSGDMTEKELIAPVTPDDESQSDDYGDSGLEMTEKDEPIAPVTSDDESQSDDYGDSGLEMTEKDEPIAPVTSDDESQSDDSGDSGSETDDMEVVSDEEEGEMTHAEMQQAFALFRVKQGKAKSRKKKQEEKKKKGEVELAGKIAKKKKAAQLEIARIEKIKDDILEGRVPILTQPDKEKLGKVLQGFKSGMRLPGTQPGKQTTDDEWAAKSQKALDACPDEMTDSARELLELRSEAGKSFHRVWISLVAEKFARVESMGDALKKVEASLKEEPEDSDTQAKRHLIAMQSKLKKYLQ